MTVPPHSMAGHLVHAGAPHSHTPQGKEAGIWQADAGQAHSLLARALAPLVAKVTVVEVGFRALAVNVWTSPFVWMLAGWMGNSPLELGLRGRPEPK